MKVKLKLEGVFMKPDKLKFQWKFKYIIMIYLGVMAISIFFIILTFQSNLSLIHSTKGITPANWLSFWGSYLSFAASGFLGAITVYMNIKLRERTEELETERREQANEFERERNEFKYISILEKISYLGVDRLTTCKIDHNKFPIHLHCNLNADDYEINQEHKGNKELRLTLILRNQSKFPIRNINASTAEVLIKDKDDQDLKFAHTKVKVAELAYSQKPIEFYISGNQNLGPGECVGLFLFIGNISFDVNDNFSIYSRICVDVTNIYNINTQMEITIRARKGDFIDGNITDSTCLVPKYIDHIRYVQCNIEKYDHLWEL